MKTGVTGEKNKKDCNETDPHRLLDRTEAGGVEASQTSLPVQHLSCSLSVRGNQLRFFALDYAW